MKDQESYTAKQEKHTHLKRIKDIETYLIDDKVGATDSSGKTNYEFMLMMNETRKLLSLTKPLGEEEDFTNMTPPDNDLTVGDMKEQ